MAAKKKNSNSNTKDIKSREDALKAIRAHFGKDLTTATNYEMPDYEVISSGSIGLDMLLSVGGYVRGRIVEIYGPEASGKTTLTLHAIANAQKAGGRCVFVDAEHALDFHYTEAIGVNLDELDYMRPDSGEEALETVEMLARSQAYDLIVIDSVSALVPQKEIEGEMGDSHVGLQARLMSQAMRKLASAASSAGTTIIFLNQLRMKIGVMFGSPETTTGGNALKFYSSVRLDVRRIAGIKEGEEVIGARTRVKVKKNKLGGTAYNSCEFDMFSNNSYGAGISQAHEIFEKAVTLNLIEKAGAWYSYQDEQLGQGKNKSVETLQSHPEILDLLRRQIIEQSSLRAEIKNRLLGNTRDKEETTTD